MKVNINGAGLLKDKYAYLIQKKLDKLETFYGRIVHANVHLKEEGEAVKNKQVEMTLFVPGPDMFAIAEADTFEKAIAAASEKLRTQLVRFKDQLVERR